MECYLQEQVDNKKFPLLSKKVWYYKNDEGGKENMCQIVDDYAQERVLEESLINIKKLFLNGGSLELAINTFENISKETIENIYEEVTSG